MLLSDSDMGSTLKRRFSEYVAIIGEDLMNTGDLEMFRVLDDQFKVTERVCYHSGWILCPSDDFQKKKSREKTQKECCTNQTVSSVSMRPKALLQRRGTRARALFAISAADRKVRQLVRNCCIVVKCIGTIPCR